MNGAGFCNGLEPKSAIGYSFAREGLGTGSPVTKPRLSQAGFFVPLDHGQFLGHVEGDGIFPGPLGPRHCAPRFWGPQIFKDYEVFRLLEAVLLDPVFDPGREVLPYLKEGVEVAGIETALPAICPFCLF